MIIDYEIIKALEEIFVKKEGTRYISGDLLAGDATNLGSSAHKFNELHVNTLYATSVTSIGSSADFVDGFHASATPSPGVLLALDGSGKFPAEAIPSTFSFDGGLLTGNLDVAPGVTIDGVDVSELYNTVQVHALQTAAAGHLGVGAHDHLTTLTGGDLNQYANADGAGTRAAYMAVRLDRHIWPGAGLLGGGLLDQDVTLSVYAGDGLTISSGRVVLVTPGTNSATSSNNQAGSHTHAVSASSDPTGISLLKTDTNAGLRLNRLGIGSASIPGAGKITASDDITGNRILSNSDTFVGNNLDVGSGILRTAKDRKAVYINAVQSVLEGALTIEPTTSSQRGLVVRGASGQEWTAPLLAAVNSSNQTVFSVRPDGTLESGNPAFVSGLSGWRISGEGDAEFRNITARGELHTSIFVANEMHATGGTMAVMTTGVIGSPINTSDNVVGSTFNLVVAGDPNVPGSSPFAQNDVLRIKLMTGLEEN